MTRDEAIAEVNRVFDFIDTHERVACGFACVATHHAGSRDIIATTGLAHTDGLEAVLMAGIEALVVDARPKLTVAKGMH